MLKTILKILFGIFLLLFIASFFFGDDDDTASTSSSSSGAKTSALVDVSATKKLSSIALKGAKAQNVVNLNSNNYNDLRGAKAYAKKPYTVMVALNGTDLESKWGHCSNDIVEMAASQFDTKNVNVVLMTYSTNKWQNGIVDARQTQIYSIEGETITLQANMGQSYLTNPNTFTMFINYAMTIFPADKYAMFFWNHGGGPTWAYGVDQKSKNKDNLTNISATDLKAALSRSQLANKKAEILGFDACLMGSAEVAQALQSYCKYYIGSEEIEPATGWDWRWLNYLGKHPQADGAEVGKAIIDWYMYGLAGNNAFNEKFPGTLSVVDTSKINAVATAVNEMSKATQSIWGNQNAANAYAKAVNKTVRYGDVNGCHFDVIDLSSYAENLESLYPEPAKKLAAAVKNAVVYNCTYGYKGEGLTTYVPWAAGRKEAKAVSSWYEHYYKNADASHVAFATKLAGALVDSQQTVKKVKGKTKVAKTGVEGTLPPEEAKNAVSAKFVLWRELTKGSDYFVRLLVDKDVTVGNDGKLENKFTGYASAFNGEIMYLNETGRSEDGKTIFYDSPAYLNGEKVRVQIRKDEKNKEGVILGAVYVTEDSNMADRNFVKIQKGDKLQFRYWANLWTNPGDEAKYAGQPTHKWVKGKELTVGDSLKLEKKALGKELYLFTFWVTETKADGTLEDYYTQKLEVRY